MKERNKKKRINLKNIRIRIVKMIKGKMRFKKNNN
jgi:hypothetical protein